MSVNIRPRLHRFWFYQVGIFRISSLSLIRSHGSRSLPFTEGWILKFRLNFPMPGQSQLLIKPFHVLFTCPYFSTFNLIANSDILMYFNEWATKKVHFLEKQIRVGAAINPNLKYYKATRSICRLLASHGAILNVVRDSISSENEFIPRMLLLAATPKITWSKYLREEWFNGDFYPRFGPT